jgi:hypothetical protein
MVEDIGGQRPTLAGQLEPERAGSMGGQQPAIRCRDLESLGFPPIVRLEEAAIEAKSLVDREVSEALEGLALERRDRASVTVPEVVVLVGPEGFDGGGVLEGFVSMLVTLVAVGLVVLVLVLGGVIGRHGRSIVPR